MGILTEQPSLLSLTLFFFTILFVFFPSTTTGADYTKLVYKGCADQKFQDPNGVYSQNLKTLFQSLLSQSGQKPFSTTTSGEGQNSITGWYQCRGDLTTAQCSDCVSKIPDMATKLCDRAVAARVQLHGCYLRYELSGFKQVSESELLYKMCGSIRAQGAGFEQRRDTAFNMVEEGVKSGSSLFYTGSYQSVYVLGQCEGDLDANDCGDCVKKAIQKATSDCGDSISGQIYLQKCYLSYSYYPNGVPGTGITSTTTEGGTGQNHTQRTVAIAVGGVAALGFLIVCLLFARSVMKKRGGKH
ncbi:plasmodesmata-located protein 1 [Humulus lupulus]|uniref:plasmodesmata-located protein 1 n=1 Tax=Humulus lupulus TaxID=3486 RepID=UPI002B408187|nr:plasmodesmata-located protein 1 [Humulus lupulus]